MERTATSLAEHLCALRARHGYSLQDLAALSGVSRATLSRIENGEVSPTADTLGQLAAAYGLPISQLFAPLEPGFQALVKREKQTLWHDNEHGFSRRTVSPPSGNLKLEIIECEIIPNQRIAYERPAFPGHEHHLVVLSGELALTVDGETYILTTGDCLRYRLKGASAFETGNQPVRYVIALA